MEESTPNPLSVGVAKNFPIAPMILVAVVAIGGAFALGYFLREANQGNGISLIEAVPTTPFLQPTDSTSNPDSTAPSGNLTVSPQYSLKIGKESSVVVPQGWYVSKVFGTSKNLTKDELQTIVKESFMLDATIPIHKDAGVELTNGSSTISLSSSALYVLGAVGFVPDGIPADWTVVQKPTSAESSGAGFARYQEGGKYIYSDIFICDSCEGSYGYVAMPFGAKLTFSGTATDLVVADQFYKNNVLNKQVDFGN